jgi:hypothetical protein
LYSPSISKEHIYAVVVVDSTLTNFFNILVKAFTLRELHPSTQIRHTKTMEKAKPSAHHHRTTKVSRLATVEKDMSNKTNSVAG